MEVNKRSGRGAQPESRRKKKKKKKNTHKKFSVFFG